MSTAIYIAITPNGMIARADESADWISESEWKLFSKFVNGHGNMIVGKRTYEILLAHGEFARPELSAIATVVLSDVPLAVEDPNHAVARSPAEAIALLEGHETIVIAGGGRMIGSFMKENLVDELYLDIEPIVFGKGITLFEGAEFEATLKLKGVQQIGENEIQLRYEVIKS